MQYQQAVAEAILTKFCVVDGFLMFPRSVLSAYTVAKKVRNATINMETSPIHDLFKETQACRVCHVRELRQNE